MIISKANEYADVNTMKDESCYDYENYKIRTGNINNYFIEFRLGRGKYSEVFGGRHESDRVVIKTLKPVRETKINREILVLKNLNHPNIIHLDDVVLDKETGTFSLIFKYIPHADSVKLFENFDIDDIKHYTRQMLEGLRYAHSQGIMHRDIKPHNMIIDQKSKTLYLIDWGLAEFYHPGKEYSVRVASRYYKSPELLVNYPYYNYSLDVWSFGCVFAEMVFKKRPFFRGENNVDQLYKICKCIGTSDLLSYGSKYEIDLTKFQLKNLNTDRKILHDGLSIRSAKYKLACDLLDKIFVYDHLERYTVNECLDHPFFQ